MEWTKARRAAVIQAWTSTHRLVEIDAHVVDGVHQHLLQPPRQLVRVHLVLWRDNERRRG
jgi:hypothetical protein